MRNMPNEGTSGPGTVVGVNVALSGTLKDQNDIIIYGMVDGEVVSEKSVTVGETAQVKGPVKGALITVSGTIRGAIDASERLEITETGKVFGSIATKDLVIRSGAVLVGKVTMGADEQAVQEETKENTEEEVSIPVHTDEDNKEEVVDGNALAPDEE